jgi:hypothetical protein
MDDSSGWKSVIYPSYYVGHMPKQKLTVKADACLINSFNEVFLILTTPSFVFENFKYPISTAEKKVFPLPLHFKQ